MQVTGWQWSQPFPAILVFCGFTIDDIVTSRRAAAEARVLWKIWKASQTLRERRARQAEIGEILWWRAMGCPVPCPVCSAGEEEECDCGRYLRERGTGQLGLDSGGALG